MSKLEEAEILLENREEDHPANLERARDLFIEGMSEDERVEYLVKQYVRRLEKHWLTAPWVISWQWIEQYLSLSQTKLKETSRQ